MKKWQLLLLVSLILIFSFALRVADIGTAPLQGDEAWWGFLGYSFGHDGLRSDLGITSSTGIRLSPFSSDLFAIPFAFHPDPRIARLFLAVLHLISMAVLYQMVRRYWSVHAALVTLLLYGVMPNAIWSSRFLWNVYVAAPFMIAFYLTGFLIVDGKRWARWLHPLMLACAVQAHPSSIVNGLLSLIFYGWHWRNATNRKQIIFDHGLGIFLAILSMLPWLIALLNQENNQPATPRIRTHSSIRTIISHVIEIPTRLETEAFALPANAYRPPSDWIIGSVGGLTLLVSLYLLTRRSRSAIIGLAYLLLPIMLIILPTPSYAAYMSVMLPAGAVALALVLTSLNRHVGAILVGILCLIQVGIILDGYRQIRAFDDFSRESMLSLNAMIDLSRAAENSDYEVVYVVEGSSAEEFEQAMVWQMLGRGRRVIWGENMSMPLPKAGITYVGYADAVHVPELYSNREARLTVGNLYRVVDIPPNLTIPISCAPNTPIRLSNGAVILGYYAPAEAHPIAGQPWTIYLLWEGQNPPPGDREYQLYTHLINANEERYSQRDMPTLPTDQWHRNELLVRRIVLPPTENLPTNEPLFLRVGMYTLPDIQNADVIDDQGNLIGQWGLIPVCTT